MRRIGRGTDGAVCGFQKRNPGKGILMADPKNEKSKAELKSVGAKDVKLSDQARKTGLTQEARKDTEEEKGTKPP
jgi:hypothetical protein